MHGLAAQHRYEEAQGVREALDDLAGIRRSYLALREARRLCVGVIFPPADPEVRDTVHLDVVWRGKLHASLSLTTATAALEIGGGPFVPFRGRRSQTGPQSRSPNPHRHTA